MLVRSTVTPNLGANLTLVDRKDEEALPPTEQSNIRDMVQRGRDQTQLEVRSRTESYGGRTRQGLTMASLVVLPDHGYANGRRRVRTQFEAGPEEV